MEGSFTHYLIWENTTLAENAGPKMTVNPLTPISDQERISPYYIKTISSRQVMRIKKNIS